MDDRQSGGCSAIFRCRQLIAQCRIPIDDCRYHVSMTQPIRALLFDLGDTLWHFPVTMPDDALHVRCSRQIAPLLQEWDWTGDPIDLSHQILGGVERARRDAEIGSLMSPDYLDVLDGVVRVAGMMLDGDQLDALWEAWWVDGAQLGRQLYPDAIATLQWVGDAGYRLGLISNRWYGADRLQHELDSCGLGNIFRSVTVSSDAGWLKPHPEIFYRALAALGTDASETVMVGDSVRDDIAGAKRLGMRAVWKRNGRRHLPPPDPLILPDAMIDDLWELRRLPMLAGPSQTPSDALSKQVR
jgi:HAD superfamily hydrolase (TIGR01549 family)